MSNEEKSVSKVKDKDQAVPYSEEFLSKTKEFKRMWAAIEEEISRAKTRHKAKRRKVGKDSSGNTVWEDYLEGSFMTSLLNKYFPGWSLYKAHDPLMMPTKQGEKMLIVSGVHLEIIDEIKFKYLVELGVPPEKASYTRTFYGMGGGMYHASKNTGNVMHNSNPAKTSITEGMKFCINRLTHIGDDTYKRDEGETLTLEEYAELVIFIQESSMKKEDKDKAMSKLMDINSRQIESFKKTIMDKENG
jgi:hypothetical protein